MTVERIPIFTTDIFKFKSSNHDKIKKYLMDNVYPRFLKDGPNDTLSEVYTDYVPGAAKLPWAMLSKFYEADIQKFLESTGIDFSKGWSYKLKCWYGFTTHSIAEFVHDHTGGPTTIQWSAVHYVTLDNESHGTVFCDPCARLKKSVVPSKNKNNLPSLYFPNKQSPAVEEGDIVAFPSWVDHHVPEHLNGSLRVVVAINIMLHHDREIEGY